MLDSHHLPDEILVEIFSRLPLKTLVICACSSKWLLSFISSPSFMVAQMKKTTQNHPFFFLRYYTESTHKDYFSLQPDDDSFDGEFNLDYMPIRCSNDDACCLNIVGSCNGLICLSDDLNNIILWNPSIRKMLTLPQPEIAFHGHNCSEILWFGDDCITNGLSSGVRVGLGFGFDCLRNDFKVVRLVYHECPLTHQFKDPPIVDAYTLSSGSWRAIETSRPLYQICKPDYSQCFVNGAVHWPGWRDSSPSVIVSFNMQDDIFEEIKMPECLGKGYYSLSTELRVGNCRDMLALISINALSGGDNNCLVWVMREYGVVDSWSEVFRLDLPNTDAYPRPRVFGFNKKQEILAFMANGALSDQEYRHLILLVDTNGRVVKILGMIDGISRSFCLVTYVESLALFKEGRLISETESQNDNAVSFGEVDNSVNREEGIVKED